ncbi:MAG: alpha-amylase family glycosyl hydrolase [Candidatus Cryptobacteroides sp.]
MGKMMVYQMLPRLWNSGESTGGAPASGKFSDIDGPFLEYLRSCGFTHLWLTGLVRHATTVGYEGLPASSSQVVKGAAGSPYAIVDYYDVNPYLADNAGERFGEFRSLLDRIHGHGLKLVMDFVPNHVSRDYGRKGLLHSSVKALGEDDDRSVHWKPENDFYYYPGEDLRLPTGPKEGERAYSESPARASGNCFSSSPGINDWYETVRLNYCDFHTATWDKMYEILRYWCLEGVDAFRCDMVEMVPKAFLKWLVAKIKEEFPETVFIAEVYTRESYRAYVEEVGFDYLYDKSGLYDSLRSIVRGEGSARALTANWQFLGDLQPKMLNFLENHDEQRFASDFFGGDASKAFASLAASLLFQRSPFMLYSGQEVGERGMEAEGYSTLDGRTSIFDWCTVATIARLKEYVHTGKGLSAGEEALLCRYREILVTATSDPSFSKGETYDLCYCNPQSRGFDPDRHFCFLRGFGGDARLVVCNFAGAGAELDIFIPREAFAYVGSARSEEVIRGIRVPSCDFLIIPL